MKRECLIDANQVNTFSPIVVKAVVLKIYFERLSINDRLAIVQRVLGVSK
jgi:hypothetical protein